MAQYNVEVTYGFSPADAALGEADTDDLAEGAVNLYFTDARVEANSAVAANTSARHTHSNKAQLDLVTDGDHDVRTDNPHSVTLAQVGGAAASHTHEIDELDATGITSGYVLQADGADAAAWVAPSSLAATWNGHDELSDIAWTDYVVQANAISSTGNASLSYTDWKSALRVLYFAPSTTDAGHFSVQLPHGYANGYDIYPHVHFTPVTSIANGETVTFRLTYTSGNVGGSFPAVSTVNMTYTNDTGSAVAADSHLIAGGATITGTTFAASTVIYCKIERPAGDTHNGVAYLLSADFHVPYNRLGSENEYTG
jgi:hypothetical protein